LPASSRLPITRIGQLRARAAQLLAEAERSPRCAVPARHALPELRRSAARRALSAGCALVAAQEEAAR
jgi:hypothetical protein